jgi:hypothetical protein
VHPIVSERLLDSRTITGFELAQTTLLGIRNTHSLVGRGAGEGPDGGLGDGPGLRPMYAPTVAAMIAPAAPISAIRI